MNFSLSQKIMMTYISKSKRPALTAAEIELLKVGWRRICQRNIYPVLPWVGKSKIIE